MSGRAKSGTWLERLLGLKLLLFRPSGRVSFADAMVWAAARSSSARVVYSLDERFPADGVEVLRASS